MEVAKKPWAADYEEPAALEEMPEPSESAPVGSILQDIKTMMGSIPFEMKAFDSELILHINSAIFSLFSMGTRWNKNPVTGYDERWEDLFEDMPELNSIKEYVFLRVKLVFDTPGTSYIINSFKERADELAWRIKTFSEGRELDGNEPSGTDSRTTNDAVTRRADALRKKRSAVVSAHLRKGTESS